ncbi:hypothetical protein COO60DRAFT_1467943 [Scenedesmus sp. NREL 46B-D3]|nr:hypothetical protein COO60DRAFT_1467943 [Scenedesmus sp. NREL 46B-D3]
MLSGAVWLCQALQHPQRISCAASTPGHQPPTHPPPKQTSHPPTTQHVLLCLTARKPCRYSAAISLLGPCKDAALLRLLLSKRSAAWLKAGRQQAALGDAAAAVRAAPGWAKAHWRRGRALAALRRWATGPCVHDFDNCHDSAALCCWVKGFAGAEAACWLHPRWRWVARLLRWPEALAAFLQAWSRSELAGMHGSLLRCCCCAASSNKPKVKSAVLYIEETHDVVTIDDLGDGCLYAFNSPLQPGDVQEELLPPHMQAIISKPPGSLSKASRKHFRHKGVRQGHLHDPPTLQEPLYLHMKEGRINVGRTGRTYSLHGALTHDLVRQANGQPPANFTSHEQRDKVSFQVLEEIDIGGLEGLVMFQAHQMRDSPEKAQRFLDVMRAAGASGLVPELSRWASLPPADSSSSLCRPGKKRKLAKPVPQLPVDAAAAPFAEPAIDEAAAAPIVWTMTTCKPGSSGSNAAGAASSSAGLTAMLGAAVGLQALSAEAVLGAGNIPQQLLYVDSSRPDTSSTVAAAADMMDVVYNCEWPGVTGSSAAAELGLVAGPGVVGLLVGTASAALPGC